MKIAPVFSEDKTEVGFLDGYVHRGVYNSDGTELYLSTLNGIYILDAQDFHLLCAIPDKDQSLNGMALSRNGDLLASMDEKGNILVIDTKKWKVVKILQAALYQSFDDCQVEFSDDGFSLVTWGAFEPIRVWDIQSGETIFETQGDYAAINPSGDLLAISDPDKLQILDISDNKVLFTRAIDKKDVASMDLLFSRDANFLFDLNLYSEVKIWDVKTGNLMRTLNQCSDCSGFGWEVSIPRLTLSNDGSRLLLVDPSEFILWNTQSWDRIMEEPALSSYPFSDASISPDGKKIVSITYECNKIEIHDISR